jgi:membrane peptidoglycan carboxypeptidase
LKIDYPRAGRTGARRFVPSRRLFLGVVGAGFLLFVGLFMLLYALVRVPSPSSLSLAQSGAVFYSDGKTQIGLVGARNRENVTLDRVPLFVRNAVLAAEDRSFYSEPAVSPVGIARAALVDIKHGDFVEGGSTITQQYVKNAYLTQKRTLTRKVSEFFISIKIGRSHSKNQILEDYLNTIYFGRGAYGIQAAAKAYFGKDVSQLRPEEGAVLAASIQAPTYLDPAKHPAAAQARWKYVLDGMVKKHWLSASDRASARYPVDLQPLASSSNLGGPNGYLLSTVQVELETHGISENQLNRGGLRIITTIDAAAQQAAVAAVSPKIATYPADVHVGLVAVEPGTGKMLAMYGGRDYITQPFNDVTQATAQMGSTFKAYVLAAALDSGISLHTRFNGHTPLKIGNDTIVNDQNEQFGSVNLLTATAQSINTVFVQLGIKVGLPKVIAAAHNAGLPKTQVLSNNASMLLGSDATRALDQAAGYATFAANGKYAQPYIVQQVTDASGHVLYDASPQTRNAFSSKVSADVTYALQQVVKSGTGKSAAIGRPIAGKTGTTSGNVSAWFVGYAPQMSTSVVMFRDKNAPLVNVAGVPQVYGGTLPAQLWASFMKAALAHTKVVNFPPPGNVGVAPSAPATSASSSSPPSPTNTPTPSELPSSQAPVSPTGQPSTSASASASTSPSTSPSGTSPPPTAAAGGATNAGP